MGSRHNDPHQPVAGTGLPFEEPRPATRLHVIVMPQACGMVQVNLFGGPMDGDSIILSPAGSVGPPQQLCYMGAAKDQAAWMVYEAENVFKPGWPEQDEHWRFNFVGWYSLGKNELLKA